MVEDADLHNHWLQYKLKYSALSTTTHFTERAVKVSNYCSNGSRAEERVSQFALCYDAVHDSNARAKSSMISLKEEKGGEYKNNNKIKARGKHKYMSTFEIIKDRHTKIEGALAIPGENLKTNYALISEAAKFSSSKSFKGQRQREEHEKTNRRNAGQPPRPPNQLMLATGVDTTTYMANEVQLSAATKKKYEKGIDAELLARNFPQEQLSSFRNYLSKKKKLKELVALEKNVEDVTTIKSFAIKSAFDWSSILRKQAGD